MGQLGPALPYPGVGSPAITDRQHRKTINATLDHGLSNGFIESTNTKIRVLTRVAFGFTKPEALIALAMLALCGYCPPLPGRAPAR
jgi:transposase